MVRPTRRAPRVSMTELGAKLGPTRAHPCQDSLDALAVLLAALVLEEPGGSGPEVVFSANPAWSELEIVRGLRLDGPREPIRRAVEQALELAADRLGQFRGGELGSLLPTAPAGSRTDPPGTGDLTRMAELAGQAVGLAARIGTADAAAEVLEGSHRGGEPRLVTVPGGEAPGPRPRAPD